MVETPEQTTRMEEAEEAGDMGEKEEMVELMQEDTIPFHVEAVGDMDQPN